MFDPVKLGQTRSNRVRGGSMGRVTGGAASMRRVVHKCPTNLRYFPIRLKKCELARLFI